MIDDLIKLASDLDRAGNYSEANKIDLLIRRYAQVVPESPSQQLMLAPTMSKAEARFQEQEKDGKYFIMLYTPSGQYSVGMFKIDELPALMREVMSGNRPVEDNPIGTKFTADQFVIKTYGPVDGKIKIIKTERLIESPLAKDILAKTKGLSGTSSPKVVSPARQIIDAGYESYKNQFKSCVTSAVNSNPSFRVISVITFTVNQDGSTSNHKATSTPASSSFDDCLTRKMTNWSFGRISLTPSLKDGEVSIEKPITVSYKQIFGRNK